MPLGALGAPPCRYFAMGACRNGLSCPFVHAEPEDPKAALRAKMEKLQAQIEAAKATKAAKEAAPAAL